MSNPPTSILPVPTLESLLEEAETLISSNPALQDMDPVEMRHVLLYLGVMKEREAAGNLDTQFPSLRPNASYDFQFPAVWALGMSEEEYAYHNFEVAEVMFSPSRLWEYISRVGAGEYGARALGKIFPIDQNLTPLHLKLLGAMHKDLTRYNVLKFGEDPNGAPISQEKYLKNIRALLPLDSLCEEGVRSQLQTYLDTELSQAMVLEETFDHKQKKPNIRLRVVIGARSAPQVSGVLETFVKLYPAEKKPEAQLETSFNHYLGAVVDFPCIARTKLVSLPEPLQLNGATYPYAVVMPFAEMKTVKQCLKDNPSDRDILLPYIMQRLRDLHIYGIPNRGILKTLEIAAQKCASAFPPEQIQETQTDIQTMHQHFFEFSEGPIKIHNYLEEVKDFMDPESDLAQVYRTFAIPNLLNINAFAYTSLVHDDVGTRNLLVPPKIDIFFLDFAKTHIGAPVVDLAKILTYRGIDCTWEEQQAHIQTYQQSRQPTSLLATTMDLDETRINHPELFMLGYHAAVIRNTLVHMEYVAAHPEEYTNNKRKESQQRDYDLLAFHSGRIIPSASNPDQLSNQLSNQLVAAAKREYKLVE